MRWIDLSAHDGMRLYVAILPNAQALVMENVSKEHEVSVQQLGFRRRPSGAWVKPWNQDVNPRQYLKLFPKATVRNMEDSECWVDLTGAPGAASAEEDAPQGASPRPEASDLPVTRFLGFNRLGQKVVEEEGVRHLVDVKGRRIPESSVGVPVPGMYLRATDDGARGMCAEGFVETCVTESGETKPTLAEFAATCGLDAGETEAFAAEVASAAVKHLVKKGGPSLREKYAKAISMKDGMAGSVPGFAEKADLAVLTRRLLGSDRELLGTAVGSHGVDPAFVSGVIPRGARLAGTNVPAEAVIALLDGADETRGFAEGLPKGTFAACAVTVADEGEARAVTAALASLGRTESAAMMERDGARALAFSFRRGDPAPEAEIQNVADHGELWSWASVVATERFHAVEALKSGLSTESDLNASAISGRNAHQVPYASASKSGTPRTMIPRELHDATRQALDRVISNFGDVDDKVAVECGYPASDLGELLSPEQVDAVALAIHAEDRGRGFLLADNTGVGKGRTLMTLARRALLQGRKVLVLSEKDSNLADLMRDAKHLRSLDVIKPAVLNRNTVLVDEATDEPFETADQEKLLAAVERGEWPEGIECVFATYSQFNRAKEDSSRSAWLHSAIGPDVLVIGDEIHNATSGDSNISVNVGTAIEACGSPVMSSATFAPDARTMAFFQRVFPDGISATEIAAMMRKGGEPFQEVVSSMLVADGVMIRREKDLSDLEIVQVTDTARVERNREYMDRLAAVIGEMAALSGELDDIAERHNANEGNAMKGLQMRRIGFGSPLYTMTRLFTAALLAEYTAEQAVEALKAGEKPVILVENTIQGLLDEAAAAGGDEPDFKAVVHRVIDQMTKVTVTGHAEDGEDNARVDLEENNRRVADSVARLREMVDSLPDVRASAIDVVREKIEAAGYTCGEITGRTLEVRDGKVVRRTNRDRTRIKNDFNAGRLDAVIMNSSGSTGIDLHASVRFKDQRRRVMFELQGPAQVLKQIQAFGRVSRYDEVVASRIVVPSSGLPSEVRLAAMRNQKLRRLSANVTSNRDSAYLTRNIPDIINSVGDAVVGRYAETRPELMKRLCLASRFDDAEERADRDMTENERDTSRSANEFLSRLSLLPVDHQEKVLAEIMAEYEMHVAELEAQGENPLRPRELEGVVHISSKRLFEGSADAGAHTAFDGPMHVLDVSIERVAEPVRADAVMLAVEEAGHHAARIRRAAESLQHDRDVYLEPFLPRDVRTVKEAIQNGDRKISRLVANMEDLSVALRAVAPGREAVIDMADGTKEHAIVTSFSPPSPGFEHLPHLYRVSLATPGDTAIRTYRLDTFLSFPGVSTRDENGKLHVRLGEGLEGSDYDQVLDRFEQAVGRRMTRARILTTNIFRAVRLAAQQNLGNLVSFVDADGQRHRGVLIRKGFDRKLDQMSARIDGVEAAFGAVTRLGVELSSSATGNKNATVVTRLSGDRWTVKLAVPPARRGERVWPSEGYRRLFEGADGRDGRNPRVECDGEGQLRDVLGVLSESGFGTWYVAGKHREALYGGEGEGERPHATLAAGR